MYEPSSIQRLLAKRVLSITAAPLGFGNLAISPGAFHELAILAGLPRVMADHLCSERPCS